jgi:uncharacterized membrane protein YhaH (DUF805 family)
MLENYLGVLRRYADFGGRARRAEYWQYVLVNIAITIVLMLVDSLMRKAIGFAFLQMAFALATLVPSLAVGVRRLHDTDRSGWWSLIAFVPIVGLLIIYFLAQDSAPATNRYGPSPKLAIA